jgi:Ethanolamine utilization protein EutJ (predicted chaperonin)
MTAALQSLAEGRVKFAPDAETGRIHRALVMAGYAFCSVRFEGEFISISEHGRQELGLPAREEIVERMTYAIEKL